MNKTDFITQKELKELLYYNPEIGTFVWKKSGKIAGFLKHTGYCSIKIKNIPYQSHRLAWLYVYGFFPKTIDHINGNKHDNRICNLREATVSQNGYNKKIGKNNTSGVKGVYWSKLHKKWRVQVGYNNEYIYGGLFDDLELADLVAIEIRNKYHKDFARHF